MEKASIPVAVPAKDWREVLGSLDERNLYATARANSVYVSGPTLLDELNSKFKKYESIGAVQPKDLLADLCQRRGIVTDASGMSNTDLLGRLLLSNVYMYNGVFMSPVLGSDYSPVFDFKPIESLPVAEVVLDDAVKDDSKKENKKAKKEIGNTTDETDALKEKKKQRVIQATTAVFEKRGITTLYLKRDGKHYTIKVENGYFLFESDEERYETLNRVSVVGYYTKIKGNPKGAMNVWDYIYYDDDVTKKKELIVKIREEESKGEGETEPLVTAEPEPPAKAPEIPKNEIVADVKADVKTDVKADVKTEKEDAASEATGDAKREKAAIPKKVKTDIWDTFIGNDLPKHKCFCCLKATITNREFHVGHVVSEANGGNLNIDNLRPICATCNFAMGTTNMKDYVTKYGYYY